MVYNRVNGADLGAQEVMHSFPISLIKVKVSGVFSFSKFFSSSSLGELLQKLENMSLFR